MKSAYQPFDPYEFLRRYHAGEALNAPKVLKVPTHHDQLSGFSELSGARSVAREIPMVPAEWQAGVERLQRLPPPDGVSEQLWTDVKGAACYFLDRWGAVAADLGWRALDLFGCHRVAPAARHDCCGLCWYLPPGTTVVALTADVAAIRHRSGSVLHYQRRASGEPGSTVPVWELQRNAGTLDW